MGAMMFRQQKPRRVHAAAGDVGMHVNGASHHDMAGNVDFLIRLAIFGPVDDAPVFDPDVRNGVDVMNRIDDVSAT
jgi:hypothetical protein